MQMEIEARGIGLTDELREYVGSRMGFVLSSLGAGVQQVTVQLEKGARRGGEKLCRILLRLQRLPLVVVEDLGPDLHRTIDRAADRARRSLARRMGNGSGR